MSLLRLARRSPLFLTAGLLVWFTVTSCGPDTGSLQPNQAPTTYLDIQGPDLDTLNYRQILHWWGADPDGEIAGYCIRWDGGWTPPDGATPSDLLPGFWFTTATTDTFVVPIEGSFAERTFEVHAVDDDDAVDPVGRTQLFRLNNWVPTLEWAADLTLPSHSLPAVSFAWKPTDLDGRNTVTGYRVWLDGQDSTQAIATPDTIFALGPDDFEGRYGDRTIFVEAVDESDTRSVPIQHTWFVEPLPSDDYLLIDNVASNTPGESLEDAYYRAILDSVAAGNYFVYDIEDRGDFRSAKEIYPLFSNFRGVVWYGGTRRAENDASLQRNLGLAEGPLREYLAQGGRAFLCYRSAVGDADGFSAEFTQDVLGIAGFFRDASHSHDLRLRSRSVLATTLLPAGDSLEVGTTTSDADFLYLADEGVEGTIYVPPGFFLPDTTITPDQRTQPAYLGIQSERGGGAIALVTFIMSRAPLSGGDSDLRVGAALLRKLFELP